MRQSYSYIIRKVWYLLNLNSNLLRFHCAHPNVCTEQRFVTSTRKIGLFGTIFGTTLWKTLGQLGGYNAMYVCTVQRFVTSTRKTKIKCVLFQMLWFLHPFLKWEGGENSANVSHTWYIALVLCSMWV